METVATLKHKPASNSNNTKDDKYLLRLHGITKQIKIIVPKSNVVSHRRNEIDRAYLQSFGITHEIQIHVWKLGHEFNWKPINVALFNKKNNNPKQKLLACSYFKCNFQCKHPSRMRTHVLVHSSEKSHKCNLCEKAYKTQSSLNAHLKNIHRFKAEMFACSYSSCNYKGHSTLNMKNHLSKVHMEKCFECSSCCRKFRTKRALKYHLKSHSQLKLLRCNYEGRKYKSYTKTNFRDNAANHLSKDNKTFQCNFKSCGNTFSSQSNFKKHLLINHKPKLIKNFHKCQLCNYRTQYRPRLEAHIRVHNGEKPFKCKFCDYCAATLGELQSHFRTHTKEKPHSCSVCKMEFSLPTTLKRHMRIHTGEKPYSCSICNKQFRQANSLEVHMRTHTGEKPYPCLICKKELTSKAHLKSHQLIHTGEKPYFCSICKKQFRQGNALKSHMQMHTGEKPYPCSQCDYKAARKYYLKLHIASKHEYKGSGEKQYSCPACKRKFIRKYNLGRHLCIHANEKPCNSSPVNNDNGQNI